MEPNGDDVVVLGGWLNLEAQSTKAFFVELDFLFAAIFALEENAFVTLSLCVRA